MLKDRRVGRGFKRLDQQRRRESSVFVKVGMGVTIFAAAFFVAFASSSQFMPASESSAETNGTYYANITNTGSIDIDLDATPDGYGKVGKDTLTIDTNATSGYKLYLSTVSSATSNGLVLSTDSTKEITATTGTMSTPSKLATNTWGYAPSRTTSSAEAVAYTDIDADSVNGSAVFIGVPEYGSENVIYTNSTPATAASNTVDIYYGVNASTALPSGTYSNTVVYTAIVDAVNPDSQEASIAPASQNGLSAGTSVTISTGLYPGFNVSDLGEITVTIGGNDCTNITPAISAAGNLNITCNTPAASTAGKYDVVVTIAKYNKTYTITEGYEYVQNTMQNFSDTNHAGDAVGTEYTLVDSRDNQTYVATKLADGNIWMTQDLKLDGGRTLTSADSDVTTSFTLAAANNGTWCGNDNSSCDDQSLMTKQDAPNGYLYNWYAATAGAGTYSISSGNVNTSICPKGWKLPTGGPSGQFVALDKAYGGNGTNRTDATQKNKFFSSPLNFNYTGYRAGGSTGNTAVDAIYWSRTANSSSYAHFQSFHSNGYVSPQGRSYKYNGFAIRCVAASDQMQNFSAAEHASDATGTTYTLSDSRDGEEYQARKLADGNIWMTQNLRLVGARTLTPADSNVTTNFNLTASNSGTWCQENSSACDDQSMVLDSGNTSYGTYYNWYAATAGTGTYGMSSGTATASICPKGWKLPTKAKFQTLYNNYNSASSMMSSSGPAFVLSGYRYGGSTTNQGSYGYYWSSVASNNNSAYNLSLGSSNVAPQYGNYKWNGFTVRCIAAS